MRHQLLNAALGVGLMGLATSVQAASIVFEANLAGANEIPPVVSPGTGLARLTIDDVATTMRVETTFANLLGPTTAAHIHCCQPPANVSPATTVPSFPGFPTNVTAGAYDQTFDMLLASSYNPAFVTANGGTPGSAFTAFLAGLKAGGAYFNIHTQQFGGGEIRGQLLSVPEPSTWAMTIVAFGLVGAAMRRGRMRVQSMCFRPTRR